MAFGIPPILLKTRFHDSKIKYCNCSTTILIQLCNINHYWLSFLRSHIPPAKHQFSLDMHVRARTHTHRISLRKYPLIIWKTVLKCLPYAWTQTMHRIHGSAVKIKSAYSHTIIQLVYVLSAFSAYKIWRLCQLTSIKYLWEYTNLELLTHNSDVSHMEKKNLNVHLALLA